MSTPAFADVKAALAEAMALQGMARVRWMGALRERNPALHAEVESLLAHEGDDSITGVIGDLGARMADALDGATPDAIGPYQVVDVLGRGGMGIVYRAVQTEPLRREVAVKVLLGAAFDARAAARFQTEAGALARLDHPHVAAVYDAGIDASERPYLVLQLVEGAPLTEACRELPLRARLGVFLDVCDAVQHAHQRGVVHRDLKPSNLLVGTQDGQPWAMVIDFGIARDEARTDATLTRAGQLLGTPAYMSPEQAGAFGGVVDTRTDVYALGIVLFELITGRRLFEPTDLSLEEIRRRTTTTVVPRPSAVAPPTGLVSSRDLRGDLDTIVAMALRPEPDRRYSSVQALADDLRAHLDGRPVSARGDSASYLMGRFVRRHRVAVALGAVLALGLVGAGVVGVVQDLRVREQRDRAVTAERLAVEEAAASTEVADFLVEMFGEADPSRVGGETVTARQLLDQGADKIAEELTDRPVVRASLLLALGRSYHGLGEYDRAAELVAEGVGLREAHLDPQDPELREALELLAIIQHDLGDFDASVVTARRVLDLARASGDADAISEGANGLAITLDAMGRHDDAEALYREALETYVRAHGQYGDEVAWLTNTLAQARWRQGHYREAEADWVQAEALAREVSGVDHQDRAYVLNNLAWARLKLGDPVAAEADFREALRIFEAVFGPDHAATGRALGNLARAVSAQGRHDEAEALLDRAVVVLQGAVGEHRLTAAALESRAGVRIALGDLDGAERDIDAAERMALQSFDETHNLVQQTRMTRARLRQAQGDVESAERIVTEVLAQRETTLDAAHPLLAQTRLQLAAFEQQQGLCGSATDRIALALPVLVDQLGEGHEDVREARRIVAECG